MVTVCRGLRHVQRGDGRLARNMQGEAKGLGGRG